jgi:hypothetical protein
MKGGRVAEYFTGWTHVLASALIVASSAFVTRRFGLPDRLSVYLLPIAAGISAYLLISGSGHAVSYRHILPGMLIVYCGALFVISAACGCAIGVASRRASLWVASLMFVAAVGIVIPIVFIYCACPMLFHLGVWWI